MKLLFKTITASLVLSLSSGFAEEEGFVSLFDGKTLDGWKSAKESGSFTVNEEEKAIHVYAGQEAGSKQVSDCLNTEKTFSHYILKLEYKWLEKRFEPRADWDRDAGLLFHVRGDLKKVWPWSLEMQIGETPGDSFGKRRFHTGDLFVLGPQRVQSRRTKNKYDPEGKLVTGKSGPTELGVEKPKGEWNEMEIQVHGSKKAVFILNGEVVYELENMEKEVGKGEFGPLTEGHIGLQAEWAELLYRNIRIKELKAE